MAGMDRELRDWLRALADSPGGDDTLGHPDELSDHGAEYLARVATDGTLKAVLAELAASERAITG